MKQPNLFSRFASTFKALLFPANNNGGWGWGGGFLPSSGYNYRREAGNLWENSVVLACLKWQCRTFPEAPPLVERRDRNGQWSAVHDHPLLPLLRRPNPHFSGSELWSAALLSLQVDGNAYWFKVRSRAGRVVELWWLPHWMVEPRWPADGSRFITHYEYRVDGSSIKLRPRDVVHFRDGIDPRNPRKGLSSLSAVLREVCTDNEAATFAAALLRNMGVAGVVITPSESGQQLANEQADHIKNLWLSKFGGERRGEPLVLNEPLQISNPGFSPEQMALDIVRRVPEERITAAMGIPAIVVGMGAGLDRATYANFKEAREAAYESNIIPTQRMLADQLNSQLLPEFGDAVTERVGFDLRHVRVLQEDQDNLHGRVANDYTAGIISREEARAELGYQR